MREFPIIAAASLAAGLSACSAFAIPTPTPTAIPPTATITITPTATNTPTATPLGCLSEPGSVRAGELNNNEKPPQEFIIYLPPCYEEMPEESYPVLYLLHGQTYQDDQWVKLGAPTMADTLIHSGEAPPFIMVFPDDRYWNLPPGERFGDRLVHEIIPFVDDNFRTIKDREHRALGGLSRGGGWSVHFALTRWDLFGIVGLHSPVIFNEDAPMLERLVQAVPEAGWPRLWIDAGDRDGDLTNIRRLEALLTMMGVPHEWHLNSGDHTDNYWHAHVLEYLHWYAEAFRNAGPPLPTATPTPASGA